MKTCLKCNKDFKTHVIIDGKQRIINKRKYCLECSPFDKRNTRKLHLLDHNNPDTPIEKRCPNCQKDYIPPKYHSNKVCPTCRHKIRRNNMRLKGIEYLGGKCVKCPVNDSDVLTCHHIDPSTKKYNLSAIWNHSWEIIREELDKCELLCANCHMKLHRNE